VPAPRGARRAAGSRERREATLAFWVLVAPMVVGLALFTIVPIVWGFLISLNESQNTIAVGNWVGLRNYADMLRDPAFRDSLWTIVLFTLFIVPLTFALALVLAVLVNVAPIGRTFFRTAFFIPTAISYVIASMIWRMSLFNGLPSGAANMALYEWFGIEQPVNWINSTAPPWYWLVLVSVRLWLQVGFYMILFLAALQEIPRDLYEAAWVDGGRPGWRTFRDITLPLLRNTSIAVLLLLLVNAFMAFDEFYNIMGGTAASQGNRALARPPLVYLYQVGLQDADYGHASAGAFILTGLIVAATLLQGRVLGFGRKA
jgi:multiple sugar transport system permease protein